jgi:hypothetical protein
MLPLWQTVYINLFTTKRAYHGKVLFLFGLHDILGLNQALAKLLTEMLLFVISFTVQRFIIFNKAVKKLSVSV